MKLSTPIVIIIVIVLAIIGSSFFTVFETDHAIISRLGDLLKNKKTGGVKVYGPGLHMKVPFIDRIYFFDSRLTMTEIPSERIVTKEKEALVVDLFIEWRIKNYALFYNSTQGYIEGFGGRDRAEQLLRQNVKSILHAEFGHRMLQDIVSGSRSELMEKLVLRADELMKGYGMQVVDVRVNRVEYPPEVNDKVFERIRSERSQVAVRYRASGESRAAMLRAEADRYARVLVAEAEKDAERIRGEGDAQAIKAYADSYGKSADFFEFYRSLQAYRRSLEGRQDTFILKPDSDFFKYFKNGTVRNREGSSSNTSSSSSSSSNLKSSQQ